LYQTGGPMGEVYVNIASWRIACQLQQRDRKI
jgi:hypothetical protein